MTATIKEKTKKVATKKNSAEAKKPVKRTVKKVATSPRKKVTRSATSHKVEPAKKKIAIRRVTSGKPETTSREIDDELENDSIREEIEQVDDEILKDFSEDHARQMEDEETDYSALLPMKIEDEVSYGSDENSINAFRAELQEKTQHEIGYEVKKIKGEEDEVDQNYLYNDHLGRSVSLYRKIAYFFVLLVVVLLGFIFFFSVVKTTIILIPDQERIQNNIVFDVFDKDKTGIDDKAVKGLVRKIDLEDTKSYPATGKNVVGQEAVGKVTIYNNYTKNQPLVATTRLLSANNKLFRIKETVNVPANGSIEADVYADDPSPEMAISPSRFTIPGLWAGIQDKIYAESKEAIVYQTKATNRITKEDVDNGIRDLKQQLVAKAESDFAANSGQYSKIIYNVDENSVVNSTDGKVDEEKDNFNVTVKASVVVVAFDDKQAIELAKQKLDNSVSDNKELLSFDEKIDYSLTSFNVMQGTASINATFEGKVTLKENSQIIDKNKIVGLKKDQLNVYLGSLPGIAGYEVKFYPSFIQKVPTLVDRIDVQIKK